jgi:hypothetical protein
LEEEDQFDGDDELRMRSSRSHLKFLELQRRALEQVTILILISIISQAEKVFGQIFIL